MMVDGGLGEVEDASYGGWWRWAMVIIQKKGISNVHWKKFIFILFSEFKIVIRHPKIMFLQVHRQQAKV